MATIFQNHMSGTLSADPGAAGVTINSAALASLSVVAAPDTMWIVLDPTGVGGAPEIVQVTTHTSSNTAATVVRAQQGSTARAHAIGITWAVAVTKSDVDELPYRKLTTTGDMLIASAANTAARLAVGTSSQVLTGGATPAWGTLPAGAVGTGLITSAMIADTTIVNGDVSASAAIAYSKLALTGSVVQADLVTALQNLLVPAGTVAHTIAAAAPTGWLFHNQAVVNCNTTYPALFTAAPASWKSGNTLNIPDLSNRTILQVGATALGANGGSNTVTIAETNLPAHAHAAGTLAPSAHSVSDPTHGHGVTDPTHAHVQNVGVHGIGGASFRADYVTDTTTGGVLPQTGVSVAAAATGVTVNAAGTGVTVGAHTMSGSTGNGNGASTALTTTPSHAAFNWMIKAH
jgi:microcystin-dependent protein